MPNLQAPLRRRDSAGPGSTLPQSPNGIAWIEASGKLHPLGDPERERSCDLREDVFASEAVLGCEVDCAVQLENDPAAAAVGEQVDPSKVDAEGGRGAEGEPAGLLRRGDGAASATAWPCRP